MCLTETWCALKATSSFPGTTELTPSWRWSCGVCSGKFGPQGHTSGRLHGGRAQLGDRPLGPGPYVVGCWCRPPATGEIESIRSLKEELQTHASKAVESVVLGDLNVHHWEPTRGEHLVDLVLPSARVMKTEVLPTIADHKPGMATMELSVPFHVVAGRLTSLSTTGATRWATDTLLCVARTCTPLTTLRAGKSTHPWLNDRAVALVDCTGNTVGEGDNARMQCRARCGVS